MSTPINLNKAGKALDMAAKKANADANATKHGQSKAARLLQATRDEQARKLLDGHERESE